MGEIKYRKPRLTEEQKVKIVSDYNAGLTIDEIEKRNKTTRGSIYRALRETVN